MSFPNLHKGQSIQQHTSIPVTLRNYPQLYTTSIRFDALQYIEDEESEDSVSKIKIDNMEIDEEALHTQHHFPKSSPLEKSTKIIEP
jgi:hypothetical protein